MASDREKIISAIIWFLFVICSQKLAFSSFKTINNLYFTEIYCFTLTNWQIKLLLGWETITPIDLNLIKKSTSAFLPNYLQLLRIILN